jgi:ATP-dependent Clp protease protease subunit
MPQPSEIYGTLAGPVNEAMVQRIFQTFAVAMSNQVKTLHLLMQSTGGFIGDGIAIYNYIRNIPLEVITYNGGFVQSVAVVSFLGAKEKRKASKTATFMIHRAKFATPIPASAAQLKGMADSITIDDSRMEQILRAHIVMPVEKWDIHKEADLHLTADQALEYKIIDEIADFSPPLGATIFNVMG